MFVVVPITTPPPHPLQNEAELEALEAEHQRLLAEEAQKAEQRMARQREKLATEQVHSCVP